MCLSVARVEGRASGGIPVEDRGRSRGTADSASGVLLSLPRREGHGAREHRWVDNLSLYDSGCGCDLEGIHSGTNWGTWFLAFGTKSLGRLAASRGFGAGQVLNTAADCE